MASTSEKPEFIVESYQKTASTGGWAGAGRTLWAISTVGAVLGAAVGAAVVFAPLAVGVGSVATALSALPISVAAFAATGMISGFHGGMMLGRISGTAASVAQEQEKRLKEWTADQITHNNPNAEIISRESTPTEEAPKSLWTRAKEAYQTYMNPSVGLTMAVIGAVGGLILGAAFISSGGAAGAIMGGVAIVAKLTGLEVAAVTAPVIAAYSTAVGAAFGALWSFNLPKITTATTEFFGNLTSGNLIGREWGPQKSKDTTTALPMQPEPEQTLPCCADHGPAPRKFDSFEQLVTQQASRNQNASLAK